MKNIKKETTQIPNKIVIPVLIFCGLVFAVSIILLFTQQKQKLDEEFKSMIINSLNIHTKSNAAAINNAIENAGGILEITKEMLLSTDTNNPQGILAQLNTMNSALFIGYISAHEIITEALSTVVQADGEDVGKRLLQGETVVGKIRYFQSLRGHFLPLVLPVQENGSTAGALYAHIKAEGLLPDNSESAVYQDVQSCLITSNGDIFFNTFLPGQEGNLYETLNAYGLTPDEIKNITAIINSPHMDSTVFNRHGEVYFVSASPLEYNGWHLVSFVRGPDVLLRSANIFKDLVTTSAVSIFLTAGTACVVFMLLLFSKKELEKEQRRNSELAQRLKAMFDQHNALKVVLDAETQEIMDVNPAACKYFGSTRHEMLGRKIQDFTLLSFDILDEKFQNAESGKVIFLAAPHRVQSGTIKLLDVYASIIRDGNRNLVYGILFDSTDREQYRNDLYREKELLRTTLQSIGDGVVTTDNLGLITSLNEVAEKLTGWKNGTAIGKSFTEVFILRNEETGQPAENPIQKVLETGRIIGLANHTELVKSHGECIPIADSAAPIKAEDGETFGVVMVFRDVSDEKKYSKQIEFLSYHDSLTGLYNRRYIEEMMVRLDAEEHYPVSVIMADVNGLKITNDVFGHKAGDALLKNVADLMRKCCRETDFIARLGGDEFVILMPETSLESAEVIIQRIKDTHIAIEGNLSLSLSLGCAYKDTAESSIQAAMQKAEEYMYQQKLLDGKSYRNSIISTLLATLYEKSNETEEHSKRLETYCHEIGRKLQLSSKEMDELSLLALLHDIGKVSINPNILQKPGTLTSIEWEEMKRHPEIGYRIAQATPELAVIADLILSHHERWDGEGYPRRLKEEEIPFACRILSVVDAFDAMTNDRIYRQAMSPQEALVEIIINAGKQFDPQVANLLIEIIASEDESLVLEDLYHDKCTK